VKVETFFKISAKLHPIGKRSFLHQLSLYSIYFQLMRPHLFHDKKIVTRIWENQVLATLFRPRSTDHTIFIQCDFHRSRRAHIAGSYFPVIKKEIIWFLVDPSEIGSMNSDYSLYFIRKANRFVKLIGYP